jgi:hypothetical protein
MIASQTGDGLCGGSGEIVRPGSGHSTMDNITSLDKFRVPLGNQEIELQQIEYEVGGMPFLRLRIRESRRFTIFDIDPVTAERWARTMLDWAVKAQDDS